MWIGLLKPEGRQDAFLNRIVAALTGGPFCHVELVFSDMRACSIALSNSKKLSRVFLMRKTDFSPEWVFYELAGMTPQTEARIRAWCENEIGKPYDVAKCVMNMSYMSWAYQGERDQSYYCSELVTLALKEGGYAPARDLDESTLHPNGLYYALRPHLIPSHPTPEQQAMRKPPACLLLAASYTC